MFFRRLTSIGLRLQRRLTRWSTITYTLNYLETGRVATTFPVEGLTATVAIAQRNNRIRLTIQVKGQPMIDRPITLYRKILSQDLSGLYESADSTTLIGVIDSSLLQIETTDPDDATAIIVRATRP
ncbi:hypothetical protein [Spirosoma linguale]|uniref:hypothetical protein n=1 Tax=Spirosoma linguale TaxID=108 RepID=UPI00059F54E5